MCTKQSNNRNERSCRRTHLMLSALQKDSTCLYMYRMGLVRIIMNLE